MPHRISHQMNVLLRTTNQQTAEFFSAFLLDADNDNIRSVRYSVGHVQNELNLEILLKKQDTTSRRKPWLLLLVFVENKEPATEAIFFWTTWNKECVKNDTRNELFKGGAQKCRRKVEDHLELKPLQNHTMAP